MATRRRRAADDDDDARSGRTRAGDAFSILVIEIFQLNGLLTAAGDALAGPWGQTTARWQVLAAVQEEPATVAQIARALHLARQSVQRVADLLEREGLTAYEDNPGHRRAKLARLTTRGRETLEGIQGAQRVWANSIGREIGEPDLRRAGEVLDRLLLALERRRVAAGRPISGSDPRSP
jgi:DNA-binding MarR family transcriptional regulator